MLPKILAMTFFLPFVTIISMVLGLIGGWMAGVQSGLYSTETYLEGIQYAWYTEQGNLFYSLGKAVVFGFLITSIAAYYGYFTKGGSLEVGRSSTQAVVAASVAILLANYVITQIVLV
jgi:phospholipid/cholesterol/gamma-HCH transport system permease protein